MLSWFGRKEEPPVEFPDNRAAFAHACAAAGEPRLGEAIPALVEAEGARGRDGEHNYLLRLAGPAGGREIWAPTLAEAPARPEIGDLVAFRIVRIADELPDDARLIGFIACQLAPVWQKGKGWRIAANFTPPNLKPAIHF
jgi:hypothetical protein